MIIDFHTHSFPAKIAASTIDKLSHASRAAAFTDGTNEGLAASMAKAGVDLSVVLPVATNPLKVSNVNNSSISLTGENNLIHFGCMHPDCPDWYDELKRIADAGLKGIKIHPIYQGVDIDDIRFLRILDRAGELGLIVVTHAGLDVGFPGVVHISPQMVANAVRQTGPVKFVLAHMGGWRNWDEVEELLPQTSVYIDTAFAGGKITPRSDMDIPEDELQLLDEESFTRIIRKFGADRVLFATDSPWGGQAETLAWINNLPLTENEKSSIFGGNAVKLLGLTEEV